MRRAPTHLLLLLLLVPLLAPAVAEGHYKGAKQFYFGPVTRNQDPVNIFYYPWASSKAEVDRHHEAHWPIDAPGDRECSDPGDAEGGGVGDGTCDPLEDHRWDVEEEISDRFTDVCKSDDNLGFDEAGGGRVPFPNDFQSVAYTLENDETGPEDCLTRYHSRMWGDANHERISNSNHVGYQQWVVGGVHHEVPEYSCLPLVGKPCVPTGHDIDLDWDAVEFTFYQQMRRERRGHVDHRSDPGGHCAAYRWKPVPDSDRPLQGFESDGFITRISMNHCRTDPNTP